MVTEANVETRFDKQDLSTPLRDPGNSPRDPKSPDFTPDTPDDYAFFTYSMFRGWVAG